MPSGVTPIAACGQHVRATSCAPARLCPGVRVCTRVFGCVRGPSGVIAFGGVCGGSSACHLSSWPEKREGVLPHRIPSHGWEGLGPEWCLEDSSVPRVNQGQ